MLRGSTVIKRKWRRHIQMKNWGGWTLGFQAWADSCKISIRIYYSAFEIARKYFTAVTNCFWEEFMIRRKKLLLLSGSKQGCNFIHASSEFSCFLKGKARVASCAVARLSSSHRTSGRFEFCRTPWWSTGLTVAEMPQQGREVRLLCWATGWRRSCCVTFGETCLEPET